MIAYNTREFSTTNKVALLQTPDWGSIRLDTIIPELTLLLKEEEALIDVIAHEAPSTYKLLHAPFSEIADRSRRLWGPVNHLNAVGETDELREIIETGEQLIAEANSRALMHEGLYRAYLNYRDHADEYQALSLEQRKIIDDRILDFELGGVALLGEKKMRMTEIKKRLAELSTQVESNVKAAVAGWGKHITDEVLLSGVPQTVKDAMCRQATAKELTGWYLTLHAPIYGPVLSHATDRALREEIYRAFVTRASDQGPQAGVYNNIPLINEMLALRHEEAVLLGYEHFTALALKERMAPSGERVADFLLDLAGKARSIAEKEFAELKEYASGNLGITAMMPWDIAYVSEKLQKSKYDISEEELRPYFTEARVLSGVFDLVTRIYGAKIVPMPDVSAWRSDVKFYALYDKDGELRGGFYADLFARNGKNQGAWMDIVIERKETDTEVVLPVAYLNCNFTEPKEGDEALMLHGEVETIFHEFGHVLHHIFSRTHHAEVSMNGVEWDAVECPSQVNENWAWEKSMLRSLSLHVKTGEPLPLVLIEKLIASKNFLGGMQLLRQIEFSLIDLTLHSTATVDIEKIVSEVRAKVRVIPTIPEDRFLASFTHIFAGGYAAGYYSYLWAEVLASDLFEAFTETGDAFNSEVGGRFLASVLEVGSSRPFMESYKEFRLREPSPLALLRLRGLITI